MKSAGPGGDGSSCVAAFDVGGSAVKIGYLTTDHALHATTSVPLRDLPQVGGGLEARLVALASQACSTPPPGLTSRAVAMVVPGIVDTRAGVAVYSTMLGWRDVPLRRMLRDATGLPAHLGHDVSAAATAEGVLGAARRHHDWIFLALGTGLGAALILNGQVYRGSNGWGGELAHVVVDRDGLTCPCGKTGCLETLASASGLTRSFAAKTGRSADAAEITRLAAAGEPIAQQVLSTAITALAAGLAGAVETLNPSLVVVGGGIAAAGEQLLAPLRAELDRQVAFVRPRPPVRLGQLGVAAGTYGAGLLGWSTLKHGTA